MSKSSFTVYFAPPFWVGVYQRQENGQLRVAKVLFGAEPTDSEVYAFLLEHWQHLVFSPPVAASRRRPSEQNPKRLQRAIAKQLARPGVGTKAQQAISLARQQEKQQRKTQSRRQKEQEVRQKYALRSQKKKEKHKGH